MNNQLHYLGYTGSVAFTEEDGVFFGKVLGISDLISYEGDSVKALVQDFQESIDEYLVSCKEMGREPDTPFQSPYPLRLQSELRKKAETMAYSEGLSFNEYIANTLSRQLNAS